MIFQNQENHLLLGNFMKYSHRKYILLDHLR